MLLQVAREKIPLGKCSCRLQEENSTLENALAGCIGELAPSEMLVQVAQGERFEGRELPSKTFFVFARCMY